MKDIEWVNLKSSLILKIIFQKITVKHKIIQISLNTLLESFHREILINNEY